MTDTPSDGASSIKEPHPNIAALQELNARRTRAIDRVEKLTELINEAAKGVDSVPKPEYKEGNVVMIMKFASDADGMCVNGIGIVKAYNQEFDVYALARENGKIGIYEASVLYTG